MDWYLKMNLFYQEKGEKIVGLKCFLLNSTDVDLLLSFFLKSREKVLYILKYSHSLVHNSSFTFFTKRKNGLYIDLNAFWS